MNKEIKIKDKTLSSFIKIRKGKITIPVIKKSRVKDQILFTGFAIESTIPENLRSFSM